MGCSGCFGVNFATLCSGSFLEVGGARANASEVTTRTTSDFGSTGQDMSAAGSMAHLRCRDDDEGKNGAKVAGCPCNPLAATSNSVSKMAPLVVHRGPTNFRAESANVEITRF